MLLWQKTFTPTLNHRHPLSTTTPPPLHYNVVGEGWLWEGGAYSLIQDIVYQLQGAMVFSTK